MQDSEFSPTQLDQLVQPNNLTMKPSWYKDQPVLRKFGIQASEPTAMKMNKLTKQLFWVGGTIILGVGVYLTLQLITAKKAPMFSFKVPAVFVAPMPLPVASAPNELVMIDIEDLDINTFPIPKTLEEAQLQIRQMKEKVGFLDKNLNEAKEEITDLEQEVEEIQAKVIPALDPDLAPATKAKAKPILVRKLVAKPVVQNEYVAVSVISINAERVLVADSSQPNMRQAVSVGGLLPGGSKFIGFDEKTRTMRTDHGDFPIP